MIKRKVAEVVGPLRPEPARPLGQGPDGDPGGLPARGAVPDRHRRPVPHRDGRAAPGRAAPGAAVRPQGPVRPVHLLPGLPAPGPVHHGEPAADPGDPARASCTASGSTTRPGSPTRRWPASTSSCAPTRPRGSARSTPRRSRPDRRGDPALGRRLRATRSSASSARARRGDCSSGTATALPETYKDSHTAHEAAQDLAMLELLDEPGQLVLHLFRRRKNDDDVRFKVFRYGEPMTLSDVLPVLHSLGVRVEDERPYEVRRADGTRPHLRLRPDPCRPGARDIAERPGQGGERVLRRLARRVRSGPLQRAGAAGRADLAAGRRAAGLREVPAPGRHRVLPGVHGDDAVGLPGDRRPAGGAVRDPPRPGPPAASTDDRETRAKELAEEILQPARRRSPRSTRTGSCART